MKAARKNPRKKRETINSWAIMVYNLALLSKNRGCSEYLTSQREDLKGAIIFCFFKEDEHR